MPRKVTKANPSFSFHSACAFGVLQEFWPQPAPWVSATRRDESWAFMMAATSAEIYLWKSLFGHTHYPLNVIEAQNWMEYELTGFWSCWSVRFAVAQLPCPSQQRYDRADGWGGDPCQC